MIPDIKKILYATDLSENSSSYPFSYAVDLAKRHSANIVILHVVESGHSISYAGSGVEAMLRKAKKEEQEMSVEEVQKRIDVFCKKTEALMGDSCVELVSKIIVPMGNPIEEILKAADEEGCDVIVMGTHKKGFLTQAFLGSVARSVLERTRKPVLFVPLPSEHANIARDDA